MAKLESFMIWAIGLIAVVSAVISIIAIIEAIIKRNTIPGKYVKYADTIVKAFSRSQVYEDIVFRIKAYGRDWTAIELKDYPEGVEYTLVFEQYRGYDFLSSIIWSPNIYQKGVNWENSLKTLYDEARVSIKENGTYKQQTANKIAT